LAQGSNWTRGAVLWRMSFRVVSVWKRPVAAEETKGEVFFRRERVTARCDVRENGLPDDHVFTKQERAKSMTRPGDRAVLAQSEEHYAELRAQFPKTAETLRESGFGEQLTVVGVDSSSLCVGDVFASAQSPLVLQVSGPRLACMRVDKKHPTGLRSGAPGTVRQVGSANGRCGFFFRVLELGTVADGDTFTCTRRGTWSVERVSALCYPISPMRIDFAGSQDELNQLLALDELMVHEWRDRLQEVSLAPSGNGRAPGEGGDLEAPSLRTPLLGAAPENESPEIVTQRRKDRFVAVLIACAVFTNCVVHYYT